MSVAITVQFPEPVYQRLQQQAYVLKRSVDDIVLQTVERGLPLWFEIIPPDIEQQLAQLDHSSLSQLQKLAKSKFAPAKQRKLDRLLQKNSECALTSKEVMELDHIQLEANVTVHRLLMPYLLPDGCMITTEVN